MSLRINHEHYSEAMSSSFLSFVFLYSHTRGFASLSTVARRASARGASQALACAHTYFGICMHVCMYAYIHADVCPNYTVTPGSHVYVRMHPFNEGTE